MPAGGSPVPSDIADAVERAAARLGRFAGRLAYRSSVDSTNLVAGEFARTEPGEGRVVLADAQTAGRGRLGRTWVSPPGTGLYMSVVLRPSHVTAPLLTLMAGVAAAEGIEAATGWRPELKWPNDLVVGRLKLGGILAEGSSGAEGLQSVVLGIGINLQNAAYPREVAGRATSLEAELGRPVERAPVFIEVLAALEHRYAQLSAGRRAGLLDDWRALAVSSRGRRVEWEDAEGGVRTGLSHGIDESGALLVRTDTGIERIVAGEVRWT